MAVPVWVWVAAAVVIAVVVAEVTATGRAGHGSSPARRAAGWAGVYVFLAIIFGLGLGISFSWTAAGQFYAGYLTEYSLSLDNLFIFYVIMSWLAVPPGRQHRVLLYGIGLSLILRSALIVAGTAAINRFGWLFYPLGGLLLWTAISLITGRADDPSQQRPGRLLTWLRGRLLRAEEDRAGRRSGAEGGRRAGWPVISPVLLLAAAIATADVMFAFDSIPAIFGITTRPLLIVACNVFALMGLRQVYVLLVRVLDRIIYLNSGLAVVCAFIGGKLLLEALHDSGVPWAVHIPTWLSVAVVIAILLVTAVASGPGRAAGRKWRGRDPGVAPAPGHPRPGAAARAPGGPLLSGRPLSGRPLPSRERAALERRFAVIDTDGNGRWQRGDCEYLARRLCETFGHALDSGPGRAVVTGQRALFDTLLRHMDADGNHEISRDEFVAGLGQAIPDRPAFDTAVHTAALTLVQVADRDGNGVLDSGEYAELAAVYGASADEAAAAFERLDLDRNGVLDTAELTVAISQFFASPAGPPDRVLRPTG